MDKKYDSVSTCIRKNLKADKTMIPGLWHIVVKAADGRPEGGQVF